MEKNSNFKVVKRILATLWPITQNDLLAYSIVFLAYFLTAKFFLYIFFTYQTSPALIWPPIGIALAAMLLRGYKMAIPIFLAQFLVIIEHYPEAYLAATILAFAHTLQASAGLFVLRTFNFKNDFGKVREVLLFTILALFVTTISPTIETILRMTQDTLVLSPIGNWARGWGGGIFSVLTFTPIIIKLVQKRQQFIDEIQKVKMEALAAFAVLSVINYVVFWTILPRFMGIVVIFLLPAVLIWFALRLHPRWLALATFATALQSIAGAIIANVSNNPLNEQLLAIQIYVSLVAAIFYVFAAVVEERRATYKELERSYKITLASDKAKNDFIAILAHELRNPLAPVISSLDLLKLQSNQPSTIAIVDNALEHTRMMRHLLDDLLDMARLVQGKITLREESVHVRQIFKQSLASVEEYARSRSITINADLPNADACVYADPVRLKQVIINLLNNACKYTHRGGTVSLMYSTAPGSCSIRVKDNGVGIPKDMLQRIFEPFRQVDGNARYGSGLGIGLFLTRKLVDMHGGTITVYSEGIGKGSTFTVTLPQQQTQETPMHIQQNSTSEKKYKILIVDDNEAAANILQKLLRLHGHDTEVAYSGQDAILKITIFDPQVVFLDIGMPDMDGYETASKLREKNWRGSIVALSGFGQESDKQRSKEAGFNGHLVKPVGIDDILVTLSQVHAQKSA